MSAPDAKADLHEYLRSAREALLWKLDGLGEYDLRRPMTPTGTNLLGLVKHVASVAAGYFGQTFARPFPEPMPWFEDGAEPNADLWATDAETPADIVALYHRVWAHADATIEALPLDAVGRVPWWPAAHATVSLHRVLVHMLAETERHAGHADILRETIDGAAGLRPASTNLPDRDESWWREYHERLQELAERAGRG